MNWEEVYNQVVRFLPRFEIVNPDQIGVLIRCGKFKKELQSGVIFCYPYFDEVFTDISSTRVVRIPSQSLKTLDNKLIAITADISFGLWNAELAILKIDDIGEYIQAVIAGRISKYISHTNYEDIKIDSLIKNVLTKKFRDEMHNDWGVDIETLYIYDLVLHKTLRLLTTKSTIDG